MNKYLFSPENFQYSEKYSDNRYEYRHVILPKEMKHVLSTTRLMTQAEWRSLGVDQCDGWSHYLIHRPEPHVLLFRRRLKMGAYSDDDEMSN